MPIVSAPARGAKDARAGETLAPRTKAAVGPVRRPADAAFASLLAPLGNGDSIRVGAVGVTGSGKTTALKQFLARAGGAFDVVLIDDQKMATPDFDGECVDDGDVVLTRDPQTMKPPVVLVVRRAAAEKTAALALRLADAGVKTCLVIGELSRVVTDGGKEVTAPSVRIALLEGRARGVSLFWTTQMATRTPGIFFDQSAVLLFNPGRKGLGYLDRIDAVGPDELSTVPTLRVMQTDPQHVGEFIVVRADGDGDGIIYQVTPNGPRQRR